MSDMLPSLVGSETVTVLSTREPEVVTKESALRALKEFCQGDTGGVPHGPLVFRRLSNLIIHETWDEPTKEEPGALSLAGRKAIAGADEKWKAFVADRYEDVPPENLIDLAMSLKGVDTLVGELTKLGLSAVEIRKALEKKP